MFQWDWKKGSQVTLLKTCTAWCFPHLSEKNPDQPEERLWYVGLQDHDQLDIGPNCWMQCGTRGNSDNLWRYISICSCIWINTIICLIFDVKKISFPQDWRKYFTWIFCNNENLLRWTIRTFEIITRIRFKHVASTVLSAGGRDTQMPSFEHRHPPSMSLLRYFKTASGLPDPKGPLSKSISSSVIASANREVLETAVTAKKRGSYTR